MPTNVTVYSPPRSCAWTPAGRTRHGTRYQVVVMTADGLHHPMFGTVSPAVLHLLATNHTTLLGGQAAVYLPDEAGRRTEDPSNCVGVVTDLRVRGADLLADVEIRDHAVRLSGYDVSATVMSSYVDTRTGRPGGPALITLDLRPNGKANTMADDRTPGIRFRLGDDGLAHRVMPSHLVDHHVARLTAEAEGMGLTQSTTGTAPRQPGTAAQIARYTAMADQLGIGEAGSVELPSLGRN